MRLQKINVLWYITVQLLKDLKIQKICLGVCIEKMTDNELLLQDRIEKIQKIINKYGEENFYISFSGGKDSCVVSDLIDWSLPKNKIPRVYADTGIELNMIRNFVYDLQKKDDRIVTIEPTKNIRNTLEEFGYPFKSKVHSLYLSVYQNNKFITKGCNRYLNPERERGRFVCPKILRYQFTPEFNLKVSNKCCDKLKKEPMKKWMKENKKTFTITGMLKEEGGARVKLDCFNLNNKTFHPLAMVTKKWEDWFIKEYDVKICDIYKDPYNFPRTGCKGCPFIINLQEELDVLEQYFPAERKQCELIWKPVYDEYRKIGYRLKKG